MLASPSLPAQTPAAGPPAQTPAVTSIRFWSLGNTTRVAVEVSGEVRIKYQTLTSPDRIAVDISEARMRLGDKALHVVKVGDKLVRQIRVAQKDALVTRVVLDLEGPVEQEISQLANPSRIMIEVRAPGQRSAPAVVSQSRTAVEKIDAAPPKPEPAKPEPARPEPVKPEPVKPEPQPPPKARPEIAKAEPPPSKPEPVTRPPLEPEPTPQPLPPSSGAPDNTPRAARPNAQGSRSLTRALGLKIGRVVLDAGHGGNDHGTTGPTGLAEKDLVLDVTLRLGALIQQRLGAEVIYTRDSDVYVPLEERGAIANQTKADLFLSIHANSSSIKAISGAEVYYLNFTNSKESLDVAARENASHGKSIFELRELIQKIALKDKLEESQEFAGRVQSALYSTWTKMNPATRNRGVKKAPFVVLIGASMPAVLAEIGFVSNPRDEILLKKPDQRQRIAEALFKGIQQYASGLGQTQRAALLDQNPTR
ncbi:MAG: N-acetylmuramoyl-L-alanine amidase [Acidobacteria bacterium]|nr:N-acetylmuramoyl-L-alanine amidase [Acidobacteriota bacterium]